MFRKLDQYLIILEQCISCHQLEFINTHLTKLEYVKHAYHNNVLNSMRSNSYDLDVFHSLDQNFLGLNQVVRNAVMDYCSFLNLKHFNYPAISIFSSIRINRYCENTSMDFHCDHISTMFDGKKRGIPILSILGSLNDDYEGGELIFFEDKKITLKAGDVMVFPSNFLYPHKVNTITKGIRYSFVCWAA